MSRTLLALVGMLFWSIGAIAATTDGRLALPLPGTYTLNHIQRVPFAIVLEGNHVPRLLSRYTTRSITLLAFFYTSCGDPEGCPRAWEAFERVRGAMKDRDMFHGKVRLVFMSLDPTRDTPHMLQIFARTYAADATIVPWHFLTTYSPVFLSSLLRDMGTEVALDRMASTQGAQVLNHLLKVFLIDKEGWVREIYSIATLDPEAILADIETLLIEAGKTGN